MDIELSPKHPALVALVVIALLGGGGWYAAKNPERFMQILRSSYDRDAIVNVEKMRAALDENLLLFLRGELIKEGLNVGTPAEQRVTMSTPLTLTEVRARPLDHFRDAHEFATSRTERRIRIHLHYTHPHGSGQATGEAILTRANHWTLLSVELVR